MNKKKDTELQMYTMMPSKWKNTHIEKLKTKSIKKK